MFLTTYLITIFQNYLMSSIIFQEVSTWDYIFICGISRKFLVKGFSVKSTAQMLNTIWFSTKIHATSQKYEHLCTLGKIVILWMIHNILCLFYRNPQFIPFNGLWSFWVWWFFSIVLFWFFGLFFFGGEVFTLY